MKHTLTTLLLFLTITSCSFFFQENKYIIPEEDFKNILLDIHLLEGLEKTNNFPEYTDKFDSAYYKVVFNNYNYSSEQFDSTINYYFKNDLHKFQTEIYNDIINRLSEMQGLIENQSKSE